MQEFAENFLDQEKRKPPMPKQNKNVSPTRTVNGLGCLLQGPKLLQNYFGIEVNAYYATMVQMSLKVLREWTNRY